MHRNNLAGQCIYGAKSLHIMHMLPNNIKFYACKQVFEGLEMGYIN
jgi:hypothetical protein